MKNQTNLKKIAIIILFLLGTECISAQIIDIGQDAEHVKQVIQYTTENKNRPDSYGNYPSSKVNWDVVYKNGDIIEVIQCYYDQFKIELNMITDYCTFYIMEEGKLSHINTQYGNVSLEKLKNAYKKKYEGFIYNGLFFEQSFDYYLKIYLSDNNLATVEFRKTILEELPVNIRKTIGNKQKVIRNAKEEELQAQQVEYERIEKAKSIVYDLKIHDKAKYDECLSQLKSRINRYIDQNKNELTQDDSEKRFNNTYSAYFKIVDQSRPSVQYGNIISAGTTNDFKITKELTLLSGTDKNCLRFQNMCIENIPILIKDGIHVTTEAKFDSIKIDYFQGTCYIKIKNGETKFTANVPDSYIAEKIKLKATFEENGKYIVHYFYKNIMGDINLNFEFVKFQFINF